jgi:hypothetical protein
MLQKTAPSARAGAASRARALGHVVRVHPGVPVL